jgi:hypothetical protein
MQILYLKAIVVLKCNFTMSDVKRFYYKKYFYLSGQVNSTDALAVHNRYRQKAAQKYKTTDMLKMVWDNEVAMVAQKWRLP